MRKSGLILLNLLLLLFTFNIKAGEVISYECESESRTADEIVQVTLDYSKKIASIAIDGKKQKSLTNLSFTQVGDIDSGQADGDFAVVTIRLKNNKKILLARNYDDLSIDIEETNLSLKKKETVFMCD